MTTLKLHNTLTKSVDELRPLHAEEISIYSCGPTVYDYVHIGNLSAFITADILRRTAALQGKSVKHVMNFTDVDDKTIRRSKEKYPELDATTALQTLTQEYGAAFLEDMQRVGNDVEAVSFIKATDPATMDAMRSLITYLYRNGFAYIAEDGIYFSIDAYKKSGKVYGQLVAITEASTSSQRIQNDEYDKESAHDFALWKTKKLGEPAWDFTLDGHDLSGRPGWHIECSAMSYLKLGQPFDIHTGGIDLAFPHHENEIAQSTAGQTNPVYASTFVHNEHILVDDKKMAKSAGNFYTLKDLIQKGVEPLAFRLLVLQSHYRKPTNFSLENAQAAHNRLKHWRAVAALRWQVPTDASPEADSIAARAIEKVNIALNDDLNTPEALQVVDDTFTELETMPLNQIQRHSLEELLTHIDKVLGLQLMSKTPDISDEVKKLISDRQHARDNKEWAESDRLRDIIREHKVAINDTAHGAIWSYES